MKKKIIFAAIIMMLLTALCGLSASAEVSGYYTYTVTNGEATITDIDMSIFGAVTVPATLGGYPVRMIGEEAFFGCESLTSIHIPEGVTFIGNDAFRGCSGLTSITIPSSVTSIGNCSFAFCERLTSIDVSSNNAYYTSDADGVLFNKAKTELVQYPIGKLETHYTIPDNVTSIGGGAFDGCSTLTSITIPVSVTRIEERAFAYCVNLTSITIPDSVNSMENEAFVGCYNLTGITLSDSIPRIGENAFGGCSNLTSITIPNSVTSIGSGAFNYCISLTSITIPNNVVSIGDYAFSGCNNLTSITIPNSVINIMERTFVGCSSLSSIIIPNSVTSIGDFAFEGCSSLLSITIPNSVSSIGSSIFSGCSNLSSIEVDSNNAYFSNDAYGVLFNKAQTELIQYPIGNPRTNYTIPVGVITIEDSAFSVCNSLTSITIPVGVTSIGRYAFSGCSSLMSITIPDSVTSIEEYAFGGCSSLTNITIPDSVSYIGNDAFQSCNNLTSITLPNGITRIEKWTFLGCSNLISVTIPDGVNYIGYEAFAGCNSLKSITIPNSVNYIGYEAFTGCSSLTSITIPDSINFIEYRAFRNCSGLTSITIPNSVTSIGYEAFVGCDELTIHGYTYSVAENYATENSIPFVSLGYCGTCGMNLTWVLTNDGVLTITGTGEMYNYAPGTAPWYANRASITAVLFPDGIAHIGSYAFADCTALSQLEVKSKTATIGENAFAGMGEGFKLMAYTDSPAAAYTIHHDIPFAQIPSSNYNNANVTQAFDSATGRMITTLHINGSGEMPDYGETSAAPWYGIGNGVEYTGSVIGSLGAIDTSSIPLSDMQVAFSSNITSVGRYAFSHSDGLTLTLPNSVTAIADYAFYHGDNLTITIPRSVTMIGEQAFSGSTNVTIYGYAGTVAETYAKAQSITFVPLAQYCGDDLTWTLENGVLTIIGTGAMYDYASGTAPWYADRASITAVSLPDGITSIGAYAFADCTGLTAVTIPSTVTAIGANAFAGCTALTTAEILSLSASFSNNAFANVSDSFKIAAYTDSTAAVYTIHNDIPFARLGSQYYSQGFSGNATASFENGVMVYRLTISGSGDMPDYGVTSAAPWYGIGNGINYGGTGFGAVSAPLSDMLVSMSSSITSVSRYAFSHSDGLKLTLPDSVTTIADYAFYHGDGLSITIPASVTTIAEQAFAGSTNVTLLGYLGSAAETYAKAHSIAFIALDVAPTITVQPTSSIYTISDTASPLTVTATANAGTLSCVWYKDGTAVAEHSSTTSTLTSSYSPDISVAGQSTYTVAVTLTQMYADGTTSTQTVSSQATITVVEPTGTVIASTWDKAKEWFHISLSDVTAVRQLQLVLKDASGAVLTTMEKAKATASESIAYILDNNAVRWELINGTWYYVVNNGTYSTASNYYAYHAVYPSMGMGYNANNELIGTYTFSGLTWQLPLTLLFENTNLTTFLYTNSTADTGWTQTAWTPSASQVPTTLELIVDGQTADTFILSVNAADWAAAFPTASASISGLLVHDQPYTYTTLQLRQNGTIVQTIGVYADTAGAQSFTLSGVAAGTYDLYVMRPGSLTTVISGITVNGITPVDLTAHANPAIRCIELANGDVNGDGYVNLVDVAVVRASENYGGSAANHVYDFGG